MSLTVDCSIKDLTPEDFFRRFIRTNGTEFALAVNDVTSSGTWNEITCDNKNISWEDIIKLIAVATPDGGIGINIVNV